MIYTLLYYFLFTSAVWMYGIGLNRSNVYSEKPKNYFFYALKITITVLLTSMLTWLINTKLLIPVGLGELYPFVAVLIFITISVTVESLVRFAGLSKFSTSEYAVSILIVFLSVNESVGFVNCIIVALCCILSFFCIVPILYSIRRRIYISHPGDEFKNSSLLLISISILIVMLLVWNVSWLNPGVLK